jgi:uncharacterized protein YuzB (UPF0349 family)
MDGGEAVTKEQEEDWSEVLYLMEEAPCKCGVCAANLYLTIRAERRKRDTPERLSA